MNANNVVPMNTGTLMTASASAHLNQRLVQALMPWFPRFGTAKPASASARLKSAPSRTRRSICGTLQSALVSASHRTAVLGVGIHTRANAYATIRWRLVMKDTTTTAQLANASAHPKLVQTQSKIPLTPTFVNVNVWNHRLLHALQEKYGVFRIANAYASQSIAILACTGTIPSACACAHLKCVMMQYNTGTPKSADVIALRASAKRAPSGTQNNAHASATG